MIYYAQKAEFFTWVRKVIEGTIIWKITVPGCVYIIPFFIFAGSKRCSDLLIILSTRALKKSCPIPTSCIIQIKLLPLSDPPTLQPRFLLWAGTYPFEVWMAIFPQIPASCYVAESTKTCSCFFLCIVSSYILPRQHVFALFWSTSGRKYHRTSGACHSQKRDLFNKTLSSSNQTTIYSKDTHG